MKLLVKAGVIIDYINNYLIWLAAIVFVFGWLSVCYEVVMRYFLNRPTTWTLEISENMLVWVTFLGTAWLLKKDGHVKIDFLVRRFSAGRQVIINSITSILCVIVCFAIAWYGVQVVWDQFQKGSVFATLLELPTGPLYSVLPLALFLLGIQFVRRTYGYITGWRLSQSTNNGGTAKV